MVLKKKDPPRVEFTPYTVKQCKFERPQPPPKKEWIREIRKKEIEFSYHASEDIDRLKRTFDSKQFTTLCETFGLEPTSPISTKGGILPARKILKPSSKVESSQVEIIEDVESKKVSSDFSVGDEEEFKNTIRETLQSRMEETKFRLAPYKMDLSSESNDYVSLHFGNDESFQESSLGSSEQPDSANDDLYVNPPSTVSGPPQDILEDLRSPYQKFFCRSKKEIVNHLNKDIHKYAHAKTDKVFIDLIKFLSLPEVDLKCPNISLDSLRNLFDIRIENPAARAFCADTKELAFVPKEVSEAYDDIHASNRAALHRQIVWDIMYQKGNEKVIAFGSKVPNPRPRWKKNPKKEWLLSDEVPWDLVSGKGLWKDLMTTEILEGFAKWLLANPQYERPKYLERVRYFDFIPKDYHLEDPVKVSLTKKRCGEAFYTLANNMKYFIGDNELSYLPRLEELKNAMTGDHQVPGEEILKIV